MFLVLVGALAETMQNHVSRILDKLGLSRRAEAAAYLAKHRPRI